jgi:hypothetical protein
MEIPKMPTVNDPTLRLTAPVRELARVILAGSRGTADARRRLAAAGFRPTETAILLAADHLDAPRPGKFRQAEGNAHSCKHPAPRTRRKGSGGSR